MRTEKDEGAEVGHQAVEVAVDIGPGMVTNVRFVYLRAPDGLDVCTLQVSLTPLQSLRLARDLISATEQGLSAPSRGSKRNRSKRAR